MKTLTHRWIYLVIMLSLAGCGSATGASNPPPIDIPTSGDAAAAIGALFSNESNASASTTQEVSRTVADIFGRNVSKQENMQCDDDPGCTCTDVISGATQGTHPIDNATFASPGSYGSFNNPIEITESDFCTTPDGTLNTGSGPGGLGRFAGFTLAGNIDASCTDPDGSAASLSMLSGSSGIWRNTDEQADGTPSYFPQIYGTFNFDFEGSAAVLDCTIFLDGNDGILFSDCSDSNGTTIEQLSGTSCVIAN